MFACINSGSVHREASIIARLPVMIIIEMKYRRLCHESRPFLSARMRDSRQSGR